MTTKLDGGPAFPQTGCIDSGLSARDYFAAKAMQAVCKAAWEHEYTDGGGVTLIASWSYRMADAMLQARERTPDAD